MTNAPDDRLGGRLPLLPPGSLAADQRRLYDHLRGDLVPWANKSGFRADTPDGRLIGPFNPLLVSPKLGTAFVDYLAAERSGTSLPADVREVIILAVGAVWQSAYELYAHRAVAAKAGLSPAAVEALAGGSVDDPNLTDAHRAAATFTRELAADHRVTDATYAAAVDHFGPVGVADLIHLAGLYMATSAMLNGFAVPVPGE